MEKYIRDEVIPGLGGTSSEDRPKKKPEPRRRKSEYRSTLDTVPEMAKKPSLPYPRFSKVHAKEQSLKLPTEQPADDSHHVAEKDTPIPKPYPTFSKAHAKKLAVQDSPKLPPEPLTDESHDVHMQTLPPPKEPNNSEAQSK
jgi:hypothetical protein